MSTLNDLITTLTEHPGELPAPARDILIDVVAKPETNAATAVRILRRRDLTADEIVRVTFSRDDPRYTARIAWLARPEHDLDVLAYLVSDEGARHGKDGPQRVVSDLLAEPLCRPQVLDHLTRCGHINVTAGIASLATIPNATRVEALVHTDRLLTPNPPQMLLRYPDEIISTLTRILVAAAEADSDAGGVWCRRLHTVPLVLATAATIKTPDRQTTLHAVEYGILPALTRLLPQDRADQIGTILSRGRAHLDPDVRARLLAALEFPNAGNWPHLAAALTTPPAVPAPTPTTPAGPTVSAADLVAALGDNPDAWRVLHTAASRTRGDVPLADLLTVADAVTRPAATQTR